MPKTKTFPVFNEEPHDKRERGGNTQPEPLSGSKQVKNRNHSRQNHGEGS